MAFGSLFNINSKLLSLWWILSVCNSSPSFQGILTYGDGRFKLLNCGRRPFYINGTPLPFGASVILLNNSVLEVQILNLHCLLVSFRHFFLSIIQENSKDPRKWFALNNIPKHYFWAIFKTIQKKKIVCTELAFHEDPAKNSKGSMCILSSSVNVKDFRIYLAWKRLVNDITTAF